MNVEQTSVLAPKKRAGRPFEKGNRASPGRKPGSKNRAAHLSIPDAIAALQLAKKGNSPEAIARALRARPDAVKEAIAQSKMLGEAFAPEVMMNWVRATGVAADQGDHKPAMALLQSIEVVKPIAQTYDTGGAKAVAGVKVEFVNFGFAGLPAPAIDVTTTKEGQ